MSLPNLGKGVENCKGSLYLSENKTWFAGLGKDGQVLRAWGQQFILRDTKNTESSFLWDVPEIRRTGGLTALKDSGYLGNPSG
ncbi:hypothetical protein P0082_09380 [Candidatus Haliotispira prima]|uniref:Uncharacterized protein n=1 Tax=Candidatus Haliotispira prima TaxID=3034016 RepID=A0ABY8MFD2_9SPIO|nr:hypothetical protein P0082_09380 [Candidatus Haliotispira prima]